MDRCNCNKILLLVLLCGIISYGHTHSQSFSSNYNSLFRTISENEGLTGNRINSIFQDSDGFIWIGTDKGLNLFDGSKIEVFEYLDNDSIINSQNQVLTVFEDHLHNIWIGTDKGLFWYHKNTRVFNKISDPKNSFGSINAPVKFISELDSTLIIATSKTLYNLEITSKIDKIPSDFSISLLDAMSFSNIKTVTIDDNHNIWIKDQDKGLMVFPIQKGKFIKNQRIPLNTALNELDITSMIAEKRGNTILFGTQNNGVYRYFIANNQLAHLKTGNDPKSNIGINGFFNNNDGTIYIGSTSGLYTIEPSQQVINYDPLYLKDINTLPRNITTVYLDMQKNTWIGTDIGAITLIQINNIGLFGKHLIAFENNEQYNDVLSFSQDISGNILVGTDGGGLYIYNQDLTLIKNITTKSGLADNVILSQFNAPDGKIWIGTYSQGLFVFDPRQNTFKHIPLVAQRKSDSTYYDIRDFYRDPEGNMWIATSGGGIVIYDEKKGITGEIKKGEGTEKNIASDFALNIFEDSKGYLWICTYEGLSKYNPKTKEFKNYKAESKIKPSLSNNWVYTVTEDLNGTIWVGTENGLNKLIDGERFKQYFTSDGLPGNIINCILPDKSGNLWISTDNGISRLNISKESFANFEEMEGLQGKKFIHNSGYIDKSGRLFFGGFDGFNVFYPDSIKINPYIPKIALTHFKIDNTEVFPQTKGSPLKTIINETSEITLKHNQASFSIEFAILNYARSERNQAAYILEGFDKNWISLRTMRPAIYTNLDPGKYTFRVIGSNDLGVWNYEGKELHITILRPWWNTLVMKCIYASIFLVFLYLFRKLTIIPVRVKNQLWIDHIEKQKSEELHQHKLQFFTNISHELRTPLTLILSPIEQLIKKGMENEELKLVKRNVLKLKALLDQLLDMRKIEDDKMRFNPGNHDIILVAREVILDFKYIAEQKNINLIFEPEFESFICHFDNDMLEKILTNLIANALKFTTSEGSVTIKQYLHKVTETGSMIFAIDVIDTGKGIAREDIDKIFDSFYTTSIGDIGEIGSGIGLYLTRKLVELHNGTISVSSEPEKGSVFSIKLPLICQKSISESPTSKEKKEIINKVVQLKKDKHTELTIEENTDKKTILVIDDNSEICQYLEAILIETYRVLFEKNGLDGLKLAVESMPDIIISDIMMPVMDGIELCQRIKNDMRLSHIPVILLTAKIEVEDHIKGFETGADAYITKPFNRDLLLSQIKNLIRQREQLRTHFIGSDGLIDPKISATTLDRTFLNKILKIIQEHYNNPEFEIHDIIKEFGISRSVFYKKFKALSDQPINEVINTFRLARAAELLGTTNLSVSEVAYKTGFNDPAYFSKVFKKQYNFSPKDYGSNQSENNK